MLVLGILVFGFEGTPNLFVIAVRLVKAISFKKSWRDNTYIRLTLFSLIT